jgi:hypothetical protein
MAEMMIIQHFSNSEATSRLRSKRQEADIFTLLSRPSAGRHGHLYSEEHDQSGHCL